MTRSRKVAATMGGLKKIPILVLLAPPQAARLRGTNGTAHQELRPEDREINYCLAWVKWMRDDNDEAAELVFPLLAEAGDDEQQERFRQLYLAGRAVEAYDRTEDAGRSFALLAEWLDDDERAKELGELVERHRTTDPNDSGLLYFEGRIATLVQLGRLEEALQEALVHDAESYTPPLTLATVHAARHDILPRADAPHETDSPPLAQHARPAGKQARQRHR